MGGAFLTTIDTEGDNIWDSPRDIKTRNALFLPRFQELCERYNVRPTYLVNYEMVTSAAFVDFGRDVLKRDVAEIGMHLHAWNTPPLEPLTEDDFKHKPYLIEFSDAHLRAKIKFMTDAIEQA